MPTTTPKLGLPRPTGTDNVTRVSQQELIDAIDNNAAKLAHTHDGTAGNGSKIAAANITVADTGNNFAATDVEGALTELFTNVSNGKTAVASAITGKGVAASGSDTFTQLSTKINAISTGTGNAVAADVLAPKTFTNGSSAGLTGTMPNRGAVTITPSASSQAITAGYHNGSGSVAAVVVPAANVLTGTTIAGTAGTMPNRGAVSITPSTSAQTIQSGFHNGSGVVSGDVNLISANILAGVSIFGVAGNVIAGKRSASGTGTLSGSTAAVSGLSFTPSVVIVESNYTGISQAVRAVYQTGAIHAGLNEAQYRWNYGNNSPSAWNSYPFTVSAGSFSVTLANGGTSGSTFSWIAIE
jgi:hypothetical protein